MFSYVEALGGNVYKNRNAVLFMRKVIGYIVALAGIVGVAAPLFPPIYSLLPIPVETPDFYVTIGGAILVALGLALLARRSVGVVGRRGGIDVPIFEGKRIVGYRRG